MLELAGALPPLLVTTLALSRVLYEGLFPRALWLARPLPVLLFTLGGGALGMLAWWTLRRRRAAPPLSALLPLLLNAFYLFTPQVNLVQGRLLLAASVWLTAVFSARQWVDSRGASKKAATWRWLGVLFVWAALLPIYLLTMPHTVGRADTFEFQVVAPQLGIAHPTGYPLYLLLGKLFTLIPLDSVAWRLNLATAVYGLLAAALIFAAGYRLTRRPAVAVLGAVVWGLTPTQWSQAIEAEVYTLHALLVAAALFVALRLLDAEAAPRSDRDALLLAFLIGLGLTNHLTTVFLLPPAALALVLARRRQGLFFLPGWRTLLKLALACALPLLLYAYLPLRWQAVVGEPMGFGRFVDWVIGGRFQDALRWRAWLDDPTRYAVVGRLFLNNWGWANLGLALLGLGALLAQQWRAALPLLVAWLGFTFYALNYYVPDLDVFLTAAHVVLALLWIGGLAGAINLLAAYARRLQTPLVHAALLLSVTPALLLAVARWPAIDRSAEDGLTTWGGAVLAQPLAAGAAILADSEKIAPLYYLQQAEGVRPDLDILVLPDEPAYRAELDARLAAGQAVYLARFLPGLEGVYHLRAAGPLTEVSATPLTAPPPTAVPADLAFGPLRLLGYELQAASPYAPRETAVTLYWQAPTPVTQALHVYLRWAGQPPLNPVGQHPAHNYYPTYAWDAGEVVPDFYRLPHPVRAAPHTGVIEVAVAPPFTPAQELVWQPVAEVALPASGALALARPLRAQLGPTLLSGAQFPAQVRPQSALTLVVSGYGAPPARYAVNLAGATAVSRRRRGRRGRARSTGALCDAV
jgi:hypothetical protein